MSSLVEALGGIKCNGYASVLRSALISLPRQPVSPSPVVFGAREAASAEYQPSSIPFRVEPREDELEGGNILGHTQQENSSRI